MFASTGQIADRSAHFRGFQSSLDGLLGAIYSAVTHFNTGVLIMYVSVRSVHLDEVWVGVEDGPKWTPTRVSTWGINGYFGASSR